MTPATEPLIELLDRERCLELLRQDEIGRLAVLADGGPLILPVNSRMDGETVVFRADLGLKLDQGVRSHACFEIDHFDRSNRSGWSVIAAGTVIAAVPTVAVFLGFQRHFISGLAIGAVK